MINKADAACTIIGFTGPYNAAAHGASGSCTGVDAGGTAAGSSLDLGASFTNVPGGTANWSFTGGTNYNNQNSSVAIVINKADAACTIEASRARMTRQRTGRRAAARVWMRVAPRRAAV